MTLLKEAKNEMAYAKFGIFGFQGSGKTYTAARILAGLVDLSPKKERAVGMCDSETGSDFLIPFFKERGIKFYVYKGRGFADLLKFIKEAEQANLAGCIVDSVSHYWRDLTDSYLRKKNRTRLIMPDWAFLKGQWQMFTDLYLNANMHIILNGRAGYDYDFTEDEDGKQQIVKSGTKMKVESEMGYEPSLLLEMERVKKLDKDGKLVGFINRATVLKDRSDTINGKTFDSPKFEDFKSFFDYLNIGGTHTGIQNQSDTAEMFKDEDWSYEERKKRREILLEKIAEVLTIAGLDGRSADVQKKKAETFIEVFGTSSKTEIANMSLMELQKGLDGLRVVLGVNMPKTAQEVKAPVQIGG